MCQLRSKRRSVLTSRLHYASARVASRPGVGQRHAVGFRYTSPVASSYTVNARSQPGRFCGRSPTEPHRPTVPGTRPTYRATLGSTPHRSAGRARWVRSVPHNPAPLAARLAPCGRVSTGGAGDCPSLPHTPQVAAPRRAVPLGERLDGGVARTRPSPCPSPCLTTRNVACLSASVQRCTILGTRGLQASLFGRFLRDAAPRVRDSGRGAGRAVRLELRSAGAAVTVADQLRSCDGARELPGSGSTRRSWPGASPDGRELRDPVPGRRAAPALPACRVARCPPRGCPITKGGCACGAIHLSPETYPPRCP